MYVDLGNKFCSLRMMSLTPGNQHRSQIIESKVQSKLIERWRIRGHH